MAQAPVKFAAQFNKSDGEIVALWRGSAARGLPQETAEIGIKELTEAEHSSMNTEGLRHEGGSDPTNKVIGGAIVPQADSRRTIRFTPALVVAAVGDAVPNITVTALTPGGVVDPAFNGTLRVQLGESKILRMDFVNGIASLPVTSFNSYARRIDNVEEFKVEAPLEVRIDTVDLS